MGFFIDKNLSIDYNHIMKEVEIQIEERVEYDGLYKVKQSFIFNHRDKNTKYLFDNRYLLSTMFRNLIIKRNIAEESF